jgi:hypothetical protein
VRVRGGEAAATVGAAPPGPLGRSVTVVQQYPLRLKLMSTVLKDIGPALPQTVMKGSVLGDLHRWDSHTIEDLATKL